MRPLLPLLSFLVACHGLAPVARYPFVEEISLELAREDLTILIGEGYADVEASFRFTAHGPPRDRTMTFPIAPPGGPAQGFMASLPGPSPLPLRTRPAPPGWLPAGEAIETYDILVPGPGLAQSEMMRVRYRQAFRGLFGYTLRTGSYWRGPIGALEVVIEDPLSAIALATVEGELAHDIRGNRYLWHFHRIEPQEGVVIRTKEDQ